ncbi:MAG TPA: aminoacyl-tRNA hydrolase, partial [Rubricoccaceae bacterium]
MSLFRRLFGAPAKPSGPDPLAALSQDDPETHLVVVGLGNPGARYEGTRHNAGFAVADRLASRLGAAWTPAGAAGLVATGEWEERRVTVVKPQAFMNRSGAAVADVLARTGLAADRLLVVTDDLALPVGTLRMRAKGGAGGHNGLSDIAETLGHTDWPRLRVGVGADFAPGTQVDYVLGRFEPDEAETA